ncbi:MAG: TA system VapC family ribonuclease toxin [Pyrinomonadaceae bacterium]
MRSLLDINVLISLLDPDHSHHERAQDWWRDNRNAGWASCPISENGFIRIMSNPSYPAEVHFSPAKAIVDLYDFVSMSDHEFWADNISMLDDKVFESKRILGSRQLTDIYLLALAVQHSGRLVSFDQRISASSVRNATTTNLCII